MPGPPQRRLPFDESDPATTSLPAAPRAGSLPTGDVRGRLHARNAEPHTHCFWEDLGASAAKRHLREEGVAGSNLAGEPTNPLLTGGFRRSSALAVRVRSGQNMARNDTHLARIWHQIRPGHDEAVGRLGVSWLARAGSATFGKRPSGRWEARYTGPDLWTYSGPSTFDTNVDAQA